jgi:deoxyribonuclease V
MDAPSNIREAKIIQLQLKKKLKIRPLEKPPVYIAGVDASFTENTIIAAACLYTFPELLSIEDAHSIESVTFPYVPGYLSFREGPAIMHSIRKLSMMPDLVIFDGQGIAHPENMGIASHVGVLINIPSIGCAKSRLVGTFNMPGRKKGSHSCLTYKGNIIGSVLRTRDKVRPVFVSPGHLIDINGATDIVLHCTGRYRLPEPVRRADRLARELRHEYVSQLP